MTGIERINAVLNGKSVDRTPVWPFVMSFAAKYADVPYRAFCTDYKALVKAQCKTAQDFDLDVVVVDSDPYREAADCGAILTYPEDDLPLIQQAAITNRAAFSFHMPNVESSTRMYDKIQGVALAKQTIGKEKAICGWIEAPLQSAGALYDLSHFLMDLYDEPEFVRELLDFCSELAVEFAVRQVEAGADIIGMGDAMASMVSTDIYKEYVFPYTKRVVDNIRNRCDVKMKYHICGNTTHLLGQVKQLGFDIVNIDSLVDITQARSLLGNAICIKGNINPVQVLLEGNEKLVEQKSIEVIKKGGSKFILSPGCEVPKNTPHPNLHAMVRASQNDRSE